VVVDPARNKAEWTPHTGHILTERDTGMN
jgi:hypothetical protein